MATSKLLVNQWRSKPQLFQPLMHVAGDRLLRLGRLGNEPDHHRRLHAHLHGIIRFLGFAGDHMLSSVPVSVCSKKAHLGGFPSRTGALRGKDPHHRFRAIEATPAAAPVDRSPAYRLDGPQVATPNLTLPQI